MRSCCFPRLMVARRFRYMTGIGLAALSVATGSLPAADNLRWQVTKIEASGNFAYVPTLRFTMDAYDPVQAFVQRPGDSTLYPVTPPGAETDWIWRSSGAGQLNFGGTWGLKLIDSAEKESAFSFVIHDASPSAFIPMPSITAPVSQNAVIETPYTFQWNSNGADLVADQLWLQVVGSTSSHLDNSLSSSVTQWTPDPLPTGSVMFKLGYVIAAPSQISDLHPRRRREPDGACCFGVSDLLGLSQCHRGS